MNRQAQAMMGLVAAGLLGSTAAHAAGLPDSYVAVDAFAVQHEERIPDRDLGFGARVGVGAVLGRSERTATGFEFGMFMNPIEGDVSGDQTGLMLDLVHQMRFGGLMPYLLAGVGGVKEEIGPVDDGFLSFEVGAGLLFPLSGSTLARAGLSAMSVRNDELRSDHDAFVDYRFNVGLAWGGAGEKTAKPAPARAVDSDGDGLADASDRCPSQAAPTSDGCPAPVARTDSDSDGVYDDDDRCAGTLAGLKVDASGCAVQSEEQSVVLKGVTFLPGSTTLTNEAKAVLDPAAAALMGQQDLKVEIGGHTDAQGSDAANQKLSQRRADSVRQYLIDKGVAASRLTAKGYGEAQPVASNDTAEGRAENRRVEFKVIR